MLVNKQGKLEICELDSMGSLHRKYTIIYRKDVQTLWQESHIIFLTQSQMAFFLWN